jgi:hypothetical protein
MQTELIAILAKHKGFINLYRDKITIDIVDDQVYKDIISDIIANSHEQNWGYYNLLAKYGDSLPVTERDLKESEQIIDDIINNLLSKQSRDKISDICTEFVIENNKHNNPDIDNFIEKISSASVQTDDFMIHDCTGLVDFIERIGEKQDPEIPTMFGNFKLGSVVYLGGRPGMWKSTAAVNMLVQSSQEYKSVFFSLEMSAKQIYSWVGQIVTNQTPAELAEGAKHKHYDDLYTYMSKAKKSMFLIDYANLSVAAIERAINRLMLKTGKIEIIYIDNLNLISRSSSNEYESLSLITRDLKVLARKLNIVIVCIAHLNREVAGRVSKKPILRDLRGSGSIEQDADYVVFLHREAYYLKEKGKNPDKLISKVLEWHQAKNRFSEPQNGFIEINLEVGRAIGVLSSHDLSDYNQALSKQSGTSNSDF